MARDPYSLRLLTNKWSLFNDKAKEVCMAWEEKDGDQQDDSELTSDTWPDLVIETRNSGIRGMFTGIGPQARRNRAFWWSTAPTSGWIMNSRIMVVSLPPCVTVVKPFLRTLASLMGLISCFSHPDYGSSNRKCGQEVEIMGYVSFETLDSAST